MFSDAQPVHRVLLSGFWMDETAVTNDQFAKFIQSTHYVTIAERKPKAEDFPGADPSQLVPGALVFTAPGQPVSLHNAQAWWRYVPGASWKHPEGSKSSITTKGRYPVVQVAYDDAAAYCSWRNARLPSEAEFERAARGGLDRKRYAWGDEFTPGGKHMANTFQGHFPNEDTGADGFTGVAPVKSFPPNGYGLYDMAGNVWEWTSDWYRPDYYRAIAGAGPAVDPQGPHDSYDPGEPDVAKRVQRGGSFLCTAQYCSRYAVGARGRGEPSTGTNHVGFRCAASGSAKSQTPRNAQGQ